MAASDQVNIYRIDCELFSNKVQKLVSGKNQLALLADKEARMSQSLSVVRARELYFEADRLLNCKDFREGNRDCSRCARLSNFWRKFALFFIEET